MPNCRRVETTRPHLEPRRERSSVRSSSVLSTGWEGSGPRARSPDDPDLRRIGGGPDPPPRRGRAIRPRPPHEPGQGRSSWSSKKDAKGCPRTPKDPPRPPGSLGDLAGAGRGSALVPSGPRRPGSAPPSQTIRATGASPTSRERGGERGGAKTRKNSGAEAGQLAATPTAVAAGPEMIEHRSPVHRGSPCSRIFVRRLFSSSLVSR